MRIMKWENISFETIPKEKCRCKSKRHTFVCHQYSSGIIWREPDNWKTGFLACSKMSEFRSHVPLFIHLFSLFGASFITLHYLLSSVGEKIIDLEPDHLSVWDTLLGAGEFKHGGQFYQDRQAILSGTHCLCINNQKHVICDFDALVYLQRRERERIPQVCRCVFCIHLCDLLTHYSTGGA